MLTWDRMNGDQRAKRARRKLVDNHPFWGILAMSLELVRDDGPDVTAWVDGIRLGYGPAFFETLTEAEAIGVMAHEVSHPASFHFDRMGNRDGQDWNIAGDHEINLRLLAAGFTLPVGVLADPHFTGMPAEAIYKVVRKENAQAKQNGQSAPHQPQPWGQPMRQPETDLDGQPLDDAARDEIANQWRVATKQAMGAAKGMAKGMSDTVGLTALDQFADVINQSALQDWRVMFRQWIDDLGTRERTWDSLDRRGVQLGMAYPDEIVIRPSCIAMMIDVSSSMDVETVTQAIAEAQSALDDAACDAIDLVYVNTGIVARQRFEAGQLITLTQRPNGGTAFASAMATMSNSDCVAYVWLTDGQTASWGDDPGKPCLWGITDTPDATAQIKPPYGDVICLYSGAP